MHPTVLAVTERIRQRSAASRRRYLDKCRRMQDQGPARHHLACSNFAHTIAGCTPDAKQVLRFTDSSNIAIVSAYNDLLSAHQPYRDMAPLVQTEISTLGCTAQFAGGVPAMCDGITQGNPGMDLSLFSRDVIAMSTAIALTHNAFDGVLLLGTCDKIVPGLLIGALSFGHLPALFLPSGPMPTGLANTEKVHLRQEYAAGRAGADALMDVETRSYHSPGTCTFYGTANSNQVLLECMGLMLPGSAFINPNTSLRDALTRYGARRITQITAQTSKHIPLHDIIDERAIVNALVGLLATGGSTNHSIHWIAVAKAAGFIIDWDDFAELSKITPLLARIYPNGNADINEFHAAGGTPALIQELLWNGHLHPDVQTVMGNGLQQFAQMPVLQENALTWTDPPEPAPTSPLLRPAHSPFDSEGGLKLLTGNLGRSMIKVSAIKEEHYVVEAPARVFQNQRDFCLAFEQGELDRDVIVVINFQGPKANGMPELHKLIPYLSILQDKGFRVALVTDGRLSGASGKIAAAIHVTPEAAADGAIAKVRDGDIIRVDAHSGHLTIQVDDAELAQRQPLMADLTDHQTDYGRELFGLFRTQISSAEQGATVWGQEFAGAAL